MTDWRARKVLLTGATGVVGSELSRQLEAQGAQLTRSSASGGDGVTRWDMGGEPPPAELQQDFDVVLHAAARTRWSQTPEEAERGNLSAAFALEEVVRPGTRLFFLSTAHAIGTAGEGDSDDLDDYRNAYEWSKAAGERHVRSRFDDALIIRFPMVIGRRTDGVVGRFSGFYKVLSGLCSGTLPAIVGLGDSPLDVVPVDELAGCILSLAADTELAGCTRTVAAGDRAPAVSDALDTIFDAMDGWRAERELPPLVRPPLLDPQRWDRFFYPFAKEHFSALQLRAIDIYLEYRPHLSMPQPFAATDRIVDVLGALAPSIRHWADRHPRAASAIAEPWS